jgi:hypothetical protein
MVEALALVLVVGAVIMVIALRFKNSDHTDDCDCHHDHK